MVIYGQAACCTSFALRILGKRATAKIESFVLKQPLFTPTGDDRGRLTRFAGRYLIAP